MFTVIAGIILRNRIAIIILLGLVSIFFFYQAQKVHFSYEPAVLVPKTDSVLIQFNQYNEIFGEDMNVVVIGIEDPFFFRYEHFTNWLNMIDSLKNLDGIQEVYSVTEAFNIEKNNEERKFEIVPVVKEKPSSQEDVNKIESLIKSLPFYENRIYKADSHTYLILVRLYKERLISSERENLISSVEKTTKHFADKKDLKVHFSGLPFYRVRAGEILDREMYMFVFLAIIITSLLLYLFFRSFRVVAFSILIVLIGVVWAFGFMGLVGYQITILTAVIPPVIIVIGIPNSIFLLNKYHIEYRRHGNKIRALQRVIQKIGAATFLTNLTTAAGFGTFMLTSTQILREFGLVASVNIMGIYILSLCLIPIIFSYLPPPDKRHTKHLDNTIISTIVGFFEGLSHSRRAKIYIATGTIVVFAFIGISFIKSTGYIVDDLPKGHKINKDLEYFEEQFNGIIPLEIKIDTKKRRGVLTGTTLQLIDNLQDSLKKYPELSKPISIVEAVKFARQAFFNGAAHQYRLPSNTERNFIMAYFGNFAEQSGIAGSYIDSESQITRVSYKVADIGSNEMKELEQKIRNEISQIFPEDRYEVIVTGTSILAAHGNKYLTRSLFTSLFIAIIAIALFMAWMFSSWEMVVISMIPNFIPLLITASFMGYFGIPIKPSTVLVFSIAFGISVDNTIHFLAKYRQELKATYSDIGRSVRYAIREAGVSMLYTSIILFFGFGIFALSSFGGTVALGVLVSFTLLVAVTSNLILLPSMLLTREKMLGSRRQNEQFHEPLMQIFDEESVEKTTLVEIHEKAETAK